MVYGFKLWILDFYQKKFKKKNFSENPSSKFILTRESMHKQFVIFKIQNQMQMLF